MKIPTVVLVIKALCYILIGGLTPLAASLAQWANSGESPPQIVWVVILAGCVIGAATQLLSFLSSAYSTYRGELAASLSAADKLPNSGESATGSTTK